MELIIVDALNQIWSTCKAPEDVRPLRQALSCYAGAQQPQLESILQQASPEGEWVHASHVDRIDMKHYAFWYAQQDAESGDKFAVYLILQTSAAAMTVHYQPANSEGYATSTALIVPTASSALTEPGSLNTEEVQQKLNAFLSTFSQNIAA